MALKLKDINHPASTSLLNKWADDKEATLNTHQAQILKLQQQITELLKKVN